MTPITCPQCQLENPSSNKFCTSCGILIKAGGSQPAEPEEESTSHEPTCSFEIQLRLLRQEIREAVQNLSGLQDRVSRIEVSLQGTGQPLPQLPVATTSTLVAPDQEVAPAHHSEVSGGTGRPQSSIVRAIPPSIRPLFEKLSIDWEQVLGKNWFAIIGSLALAIGAGFFLKLAFDNDWIGPIGRVALGIAAGVSMLGAGEYAQARFPIWAKPVTAGGIGILYLSIYAAFGLFQLISPVIAFLFLALVVCLSVLLALRYESLVIALLGIIGAFLAPILMGRDMPEPWLVLVYILVVDLGILGVSTFRHWRWFTLVEGVDIDGDGIPDMGLFYYETEEAQKQGEKPLNHIDLDGVQVSTEPDKKTGETIMVLDSRFRGIR